jgi:hypothetical protein
VLGHDAGQGIVGLDQGGGDPLERRGVEDRLGLAHI